MRMRLAVGLVATVAVAILLLVRASRTKARNKMKDWRGLQQLYFDVALQYHVSARFAAISGLLPVSGNLFHHALEMYLKGYFCKDLNEAQLRNLGHNLRKLWRRFKAEVADSSFNQFDNAIAQLDRFERIRYPEEIERLGLRASIGFKKGDVAVNTTSKSQEPTYELTIDDLDALAKVIMEKSRTNPKFFTSRLKGDTLTYLQQQNKAVIW